MQRVGAITGRRYLRTRVRGYAPWTPDPRSYELIERVQTIRAEYETALTIRQVFYRLVGKYGYEKTEQAYERLIDKMNRARRCGMLAWEDFRDDGDIVPPQPGWSGPADFWELVRAMAQNYFHRPESAVYVEVWVEAGGMVPQIEAVADPFGVRVIPAGGFNSVTARRNAALRLIEIEKKNTAIVLLIGEFDPSGASIMDVTAEDVTAFGSSAEFKDLAVTEAQARQYRLIPKPQKATDKRGEYMPETWQAEALDPGVLAEIVRTRLRELVGEEALTAARNRSTRERATILKAIR